MLIFLQILGYDAYKNNAYRKKECSIRVYQIFQIISGVGLKFSFWSPNMKTSSKSYTLFIVTPRQPPPKVMLKFTFLLITEEVFLINIA